MTRYGCTARTKIREEAISGRFNPRVVLDDGQTEYVEIESNRELVPSDSRADRRQQQLGCTSIGGIAAAPQHGKRACSASRPRAERIFSSLSSRIPVRCTCSSFKARPSGQLPARPLSPRSPNHRVRRGIRFRYGQWLARASPLRRESGLFRISVSTTLVVELSTPENPCKSVAGKPSGNIEKIGTPSMTVASQRTSSFLASERRKFAKAMHDRTFVRRDGVCSSSHAAARCSRAG